MSKPQMDNQHQFHLHRDGAVETSARTTTDAWATETAVAARTDAARTGATAPGATTPGATTTSAAESGAAESWRTAYSAHTAALEAAGILREAVLHQLHLARPVPARLPRHSSQGLRRRHVRHALHQWPGYERHEYQR